MACSVLLWLVWRRSVSIDISRPPTSRTSRASIKWQLSRKGTCCRASISTAWSRFVCEIHTETKYVPSKLRVVGVTQNSAELLSRLSQGCCGSNATASSLLIVCESRKSTENARELRLYSDGESFLAFRNRLIVPCCCVPSATAWSQVSCAIRVVTLNRSSIAFPLLAAGWF